MKRCLDCKFHGRDIFSVSLCDRSAYESSPDPVDGSTYKAGRVPCSIEREAPTLLFTTRCGPKGRHFVPKVPA